MKLKLTLSVLAITLANNAIARPVYIGKHVPIDAEACSYGEVVGLKPWKSYNDSFLAVRTDATTKSKMKYKINNGQPVWICDSAKNGKWLGIVYTKKGTDCRLDVHGYYKGRCYSGWVSSKYIKIMAG